MKVEDLIYDLSFGIRLPNPTFCPAPIANLITRCFYENPSKRPNFEEIKVTLKEAFNKMMNDWNKTTEPCQNLNEGEIHYIEINKLKDDTLKLRYKTIKKGNQQEMMKHRCTQGQAVVERERYGSPLKYLCVGSVSSSTNVNSKSCNDLFKNL